MIRKPGLVIPELPETGSRALRAMLWRKADAAHGAAPRPIGADAARHAATVAAEVGRVRETVAGVRAPIDRLPSW